MLSSRCWRHSFNMMARLDLLGRIRRTSIYHNTTEAVLKWEHWRQRQIQRHRVLQQNIFRTDYYSRILFPAAFIALNCVYWCVVLI